jgi:catechol 2,3-dioxygenase-like lactoylglutathione lyase family enzyme
MLLLRVRIPVPNLAEAAERYRALGFEVVVGAASGLVVTPTGDLELTASEGRPDIVLSSPSTTPGPGGLPLSFEVPTADQHHREAVHPNTVLRVERVYIVVPDLEAALPLYSAALGLAMPPIQQGMVIRARMGIFDVGPVGIGVATPFEAGPAADALQLGGAGLFQALFRVRSMASAALWMVEHGLPPPARGTRNTGEQALLVQPQHAAGIYIALVGPE